MGLGVLGIPPPAERGQSAGAAFRRKPEVVGGGGPRVKELRPAASLAWKWW